MGRDDRRREIKTGKADSGDTEANEQKGRGGDEAVHDANYETGLLSVPTPSGRAHGLKIRGSGVRLPGDI